MEGIEVFREYETYLYVENCLQYRQWTRLNVYKIEELCEHIEEKGYYHIQGYNNLKVKKEALIQEYKELENEYGNPEKKHLRKGEDIEKNIFTIDLRDVVKSIYYYLELNMKLEKRIVRILKWLIDNLIVQADELKNVVIKDVNEYSKYLASTKNNNLFRRLGSVSTEWDKKVTYIVKTKKPDFEEVLETMDDDFKIYAIVDFTHQIETLYEEVHRYEGIISDLVMRSTEMMETIELKKKNELQHNLNITVVILTIATVMIGIIQSVSAIITINDHIHFLGWIMKIIISLM